MSLLGDHVYDNGLSVLDTQANALYICSSEPTDYAGLAAITLGSKTGLSVSAPFAAVPDGRAVAVASFSDGNVLASGDAAYVAVVDTVNSRLLAVGPLDTVTPVTIGNTFSLASFDIVIPAAV